MEFLATLSCAMFAGAALYINMVEHPARMSCGTESAVNQWSPSYKRSARMQVPLAVIGVLASVVVAWLSGSDVWWLVGGLLLALVVPFTLVVIMPTNRRLSSTSLRKDSEETHQLLRRWNRLHGVRTILSAASLIIFLLID
jgi:hypothetical protein